MPHFGDRFGELFAGLKQREIAEKLKITDAAVRNYLAGRVPDAEKLELISSLTGCNLHWLLTGTGEKYFGTAQSVRSQNAGSFDEMLERRIRELIRSELLAATTVCPCFEG